MGFQPNAETVAMLATLECEYHITQLAGTSAKEITIVDKISGKPFLKHRSEEGQDVVDALLEACRLAERAPRPEADTAALAAKVAEQGGQIADRDSRIAALEAQIAEMKSGKKSSIEPRGRQPVQRSGKNPAPTMTPVATIERPGTEPDAEETLEG